MEVVKLKLNLIIVLFILVCGISCSSSSNNDKPNNNNNSTEADTLQTIDLWTKYSYTERRGILLFEHYCANCHGIKGAGDGFNKYTLTKPPQNFTDSAFSLNLSNDELKRVISLGGKGTNGSVLMPGYIKTLSENEISFLVDYIRTFSQKTK